MLAIYASPIDKSNEGAEHPFLSSSQYFVFVTYFGFMIYFIIFNLCYWHVAHYSDQFISCKNYLPEIRFESYLFYLKMPLVCSISLYLNSSEKKNVTEKVNPICKLVGHLSARYYLTDAYLKKYDKKNILFPFFGGDSLRSVCMKSLCSFSEKV